MTGNDREDAGNSTAHGGGSPHRGDLQDALRALAEAGQGLFDEALEAVVADRTGSNGWA